MLICQGSPEFDLLLSDVELACGHSGVELAREMGRQHPNLRVLLMSGLTMTTLQETAGVHRDVQLISKPFTRRALANRLRAVLAETPELP